jgi:hypothetical protein
MGFDVQIFHDIIDVGCMVFCSHPLHQCLYCRNSTSWCLISRHGRCTWPCSPLS